MKTETTTPPTRRFPHVATGLKAGPYRRPYDAILAAMAADAASSSSTTTTTTTTSG